MTFFSLVTGIILRRAHAGAVHDNQDHNQASNMEHITTSTSTYTPQWICLPIVPARRLIKIDKAVEIPKRRGRLSRKVLQNGRDVGIRANDDDESETSGPKSGDPGGHA